MTGRSTRWIAVGACTILLAAVAVQAREGERRRAPRPLARSVEDEPRRPEGRKAPQPVVMRLKHISAEAIMEVVEQFRHSEAVGRMFREIPVAVCREANAIVVIGPPEVIECFERIVRELDQPSEYHERMRERAMRHGKEHPQEPAGRPHRPEGPHAPGKMGPPAGEMIGQAIGRLLSPPVREELRIDEDQARRIHEIGEDGKRQMMHLHERVSRAMQEAGPDRRRELAKQMVPNVRRRAGELAKELRKRIAGVLRPEQREALGRMRQGREGAREPVRRPDREREGARERRPDRERRQDREGAREPTRRPDREREGAREHRRRDEPDRDRDARPDRERPGPRAEPRRGDPFGQAIEHVLSPEMARKLRLNDDQFARIRELAQDLRREAEKVHEHARREVQQAEPRRRPAVAKKIEAHLREQMKDLMRKLREGIGRVLKPDQREALKRIHQPQGERPEKQPPRRSDREKEEKSPRRERGRERDREGQRDR